MDTKKLRLGVINDAQYLAQIHKRAISVDILSVINNDNVLYLFYRKILSSDDIVVVVKETDQGNVISFAVFLKKPSQFNIILKKFYFRQFFPILLSCIKSKKALKMVIGRFKKPIILTPFNVSDYPEIIISATDPQYQSMGFGSQVVQYGLESLSLKNCIVKTHSPDAKRFYHRLGFIDIGYEKTGNWNLSVLLYSK